MSRAAAIYAGSSAFALAAMAGRAGWVDWVAVARVAGLALTAAFGVAALLALVAVLVGVPFVLLVVATDKLLNLIPAKPAGQPERDA